MESDDSVTEIALACGYNSIANFNRQFLAIKGMNPTRFRDQRDRLKEHRVVPATRGQISIKSASVLG
jgi:AraC-like DNA-binding protein